MTQRPIIIIGNWKMHKTLEDAREFVEGFLKQWQENADNTKQCRIGLAVPYTLIHPLSEQAATSSLEIGAQNMNDASEGAFTGEIAGKMLKDAGAQFVILGHSERRRFFNEDNAFINRKIKRALEVGLQPILCIGETREEREEGMMEEVLSTQLKEGLGGLEASALSSLIVAYEPVWAIGRGASAPAKDVQQAHAFCRKFLSSLFSEEWANQIPIQYGGSVHPLNALELLNLPDVDGLLVGGAALSLESFLQIVNDSCQPEFIQNNDLNHLEG